MEKGQALLSGTNAGKIGHLDKKADLKNFEENFCGGDCDKMTNFCDRKGTKC